MAIQASFYVKIAGPENDVSIWMSSSVRNQSKETGGAIRPWSLSAWRRFAPTVPVFGDLGKRLNPRYLPVLENTCPQPTSVQERLSPRLYSPPVKKHEKKEKQTEMIPITHPLEMRTNKQTDGRTLSAWQCFTNHGFPVGSLFFYPFPLENTPFYFLSKQNVILP